MTETKVSPRVRPKVKKTDDEETRTETEEEPEKKISQKKWHFDITDLSDVEDPMKILLYGVTGVGKTVLAASANEVPDLAPVLLIDFEGGTRSIQQRKGLRTIRIKTYKEITQLPHMLRDPEIMAEFKTIIIDPLNEMQKIIMRGVIAEAVANDSTHDREIPYMADWGRNAERTRTIVRILRDAPYHVIFTCLPKESKDDQTGVITVKPALPGQLADEIPAFLDIVGYMQTGIRRMAVEGSDKKKKRMTVRQVTFEQTGRFHAKDRTWKLGRVIAGPTMNKIWERMQGKEQPEEDEEDIEERVEATAEETQSEPSE